MALVRINEKPNAIPVSASVFAIETQVSGVWYSQKVTWEQLVGLVSALDNLQNYYKKSETYTKQEVQALIAQIPSFTIEVVQQLPTEDISTTTLYLVPKSTPEAQDYYEEYINLDGTTSGWEYVGTTQVDLSNYYTKTETETYVKGDGADYIVGTKTFSALTTTVKSILGAINEVAGAASSAQADATRALADASTAQGTANSASAAASAAQTTADAAATAAGNAANAASAAQGTANQAVTAAGNAQSTADAAAAGLLLKEDKTAMPEDVTDIIKQMKTPKTVTGNPVTFETVEETYAKGAELTFGPIQDLHGYDSPWPAGAGKNKVNAEIKAKTTGSGITGECFADNRFVLSGTSTDNGDFVTNCTPITIPSGTTYTISIHGDLTLSSNAMYLYYGGKNTNFTASTKARTVTATEDITISTLRFRCFAGTTVSADFKLQIEIGSTATDYAPYSNICPISGWDGLNLTRSGKNLVEITKTGSTTYNGITWTVNSDGTVTANGTATATSVFLLKQTQDFGKDLQPNTEYIISSGYGNDNVWFGLYYDNNTSWEKTVRNNGEETFTTISDFNYVRFGLRVGSGETINNVTFKPMVRLSTISDPTFEPYNGETYPATFSETTYGGSYDFVSGKGNANYSENINISDLTWMYSKNNGYFYSFPSGKANGNTNIKSSSYKVSESTTVSGMVDGEIKGNANNGNIYVKDSRATTVEEFLTLSGSQTICYELATPTAFSTEPTPIELNKGTNVVSTDGDSVEIKYSEMMNIDDVKLLIDEAVGTVLNTEF